jgi:hypothetical protein
MSLLFNNVELLGYTHQNNFFGEKSLFYSSLRTISIRGYVLDLTNDNGVKGVFTNSQELIKETQDFQQIIINGENFGVGKVKSLSIDNGNWVKYTQYDATIEILIEVPIANLSSKEFNGVNLANRRLNLIKSFSENFSLNFDTQNKVLGGDHSIDIEYDADNVNINLINLAQSLATELLKTIPTSSNIAEGNYLSRQKYKVLNSENYNTVTGKCGFKRSFSYSTLNNNKNYSFVRTHSIEIGEDGIAIARENCAIKAEFDVPSLHENALAGYDEQIIGVYSRCNAVFQNYKTKFNIITNLNQQFVSKSVQINKFNGTITFDITFDNDPKKINSAYVWEYVSNLDRSDVGVWNVSENGSIKGNGKIGSDSKYNNARTGWLSTIKGGIFSRVGAFYNNEATNKIGGSLKELSKTINRNKYEGFVSYDFTYTDDPTIKDGSDNGIKKIDIEKSDTGLLPITKDFIIPNRTFALNQDRNLKKQGTYVVKVNMEIGCIPNVFNSLNYFTKAKNFAGDKPNLGNDEYLESVTYSSDETEKTIIYEATYKYS